MCRLVGPQNIRCHHQRARRQGDSAERQQRAADRQQRQPVRPVREVPAVSAARAAGPPAARPRPAHQGGEDQDQKSIYKHCVQNHLKILINSSSGQISSVTHLISAAVLSTFFGFFYNRFVSIYTRRSSRCCSIFIHIFLSKMYFIIPATHLLATFFVLLSGSLRKLQGVYLEPSFKIWQLTQRPKS